MKVERQQRSILSFNYLPKKYFFDSCWCKSHLFHFRTNNFPYLSWDSLTDIEQIVDSFSVTSNCIRNEMYER